jgi:hypothetical protein
MRYDAKKAMTLWQKRLIENDEDKIYIGTVYRLHDSLRYTFRGILTAYNKNIAKNATQQSTGDIGDEGQLADQEGNVSIQSAIVDRTYDKFKLNPLYSHFVKTVSEANKVDKDNLTKYLNLIFTNKKPRLYEMINTIIMCYFMKYPSTNKIQEATFLSFGLSLYKLIASSKKPLYERIASILNYWIHDVIEIREYTTNEGTISNYRKAIYNYIIDMIIYYN